MILNVNNVSKSFGGIMAVDNVSFDVNDGEFCSIIGPNGAGKSTLFNVLTGLYKKDSGSVLFKGEDISELEPYDICKKGIGRSFQIVNLFEKLTVFENIHTALFCGKGMGLNLFRPAKYVMTEETKVLLNEVGLYEKEESIACDLSHGERKRLELGITLANDPDLIFLDEPCAGLTSEESMIMVKLIKKISREKSLTVILVEHKMDVVFSISEIIRVLHDGRIIFEGTPDEVRQSEEVLKVYLGEEDYDVAAS